MSDRILVPGALVLGDGLQRDIGVHVSRGRVTAIGPPNALPPGERIAVDGTLIPGVFDMQVNGAGGRGVDETSDEALRTVAGTVLDGGATSFLPTLISAPFEDLLEQVRRLTKWIEQWDGEGARPEGMHLEGPFLEVPGAHPPEALIDPSPERVEALLEAAEGRLALVTLAPGRAGAVEATSRFAAAGVCVSLGHAADPAHLAGCVDAGARMVTHLFNAMSPIHHRHPSLALAALQEPRLTCSLITDGHHLRPEVIQLAWRLLGRDRMVLVTDSASPAGAGDGEFSLGEAQVRSSGGCVRDAEGRLAGSAALARDIVAGVREALDEVDEVDLSRLFSTGPAALLGQSRAIEVGSPARFSVLGGDGALSAWVPHSSPR